MNQTTVYLVPEAGPVEFLTELPHALGGADFVWSVLGARHLPKAPWQTWQDHQWRYLSSLLITDQLSFAEKAAFCVTLDYAVIERTHFEQMNRALRRFLDCNPYPAPVSQLEDLANFLRDAQIDSGLGIGLRHNTATSNPWQLYDPANDRYRPYDTSIDRQHWNLFETLGVCVANGCRQLEQQIAILERLVEQRQSINAFFKHRLSDEIADQERLGRNRLRDSHSTPLTNYACAN